MNCMLCSLFVIVILSARVEARPLHQFLKENNIVAQPAKLFKFANRVALERGGAVHRDEQRYQSMRASPGGPDPQHHYINV